MSYNFRNSLDVGIEIEYPQSESYETTMSRRGERTSEVYEEYGYDRGTYPRGEPWEEGGNIVHDSTVGIEVVSEQISPARAIDWFHDSIQKLKVMAPYEPCGLLQNSTAGMHIHMSRLTDDQARTLYEMSQKPWMQAFVCSSIAERSYQVFRGGTYCNTGRFDGSRTDVVHSCSGVGHYEWRLPEPMIQSNFELVMEFLDRFHDDPIDAADFAKEHVNKGSNKITSFRRAREVGIDVMTEEKEDHILDRFEVSRSSASGLHYEDLAQEFFYHISHSRSMPYIYKIDGDSTSYYAFYTNQYNDDRTFSVGDEFALSFQDIEFTTSTVLDCSTMKPTDDLDAATAQRAIEEYREGGNRDQPQKTETTDLVTAVLSE